MRIVFTAIALAILSGCAGPWMRAGSTADDLARDEAQCRYEAELATAGNPRAIQSGWDAGVLQVRCLQARGWHK